MFHVSSDDEAMVLMEVVARVREHDLRVDRVLQILERPPSPRRRCTAGYPSRKPCTSTSALAAPPEQPPRRSRAPRRRARPVRRARPSAPRCPRFACVSARIVPPHPISRSSECAADREQAPERACRPDRRASITRRSARGVAVRRAATARGRTRSSSSSHCRSLIVSIGPKNPSYGYAHDLAAGDEARERLLDELVARLDPVEDLASHHEEAAVDPDVAVFIGRDLAHDARRRRSSRRWALNCGPHREEHDHLPEALEGHRSVWRAARP